LSQKEGKIEWRFWDEEEWVREVGVD
jgi:hypothetical protein